MAVLAEHFNIFHQRISLDESRLARIRKAHMGLREFVDADGPLRAVRFETFLQGSVENSTAVKPTREDFDVDVVVSLNASNPHYPWQGKQEPQKIIEWVATRLRSDSRYEGKVKLRPRCVRIVYSGDFHMDVVPAHCNGDLLAALEVPDRDAGRWTPTHPKGYSAWCTDANRRTDGRYCRVAKMLKWWRDSKLGTESRPKSIILGTLAGLAIPSAPSSDADAFTRTAEAMKTRVDQHSMWGYTVPSIPNPSLPSENLARDWTLSAVKIFRDKLETLASRSRAALDSTDTERSARLWQEVFDDNFPLTA